MSVAERIVRAVAYLAPADCRAEWRREWLAELEARRRRYRGPSPLRFALGAPRHAWSLRRAGWQPALVAVDLRSGLRWLVRRPLFGLTAVLTLALGIGATTGIFSVVYGVLLKPLPYRQPDRLVQLWEVNPLFNWTHATIAPGNLLSWRERNHVFEDIAAYMGSSSRHAGLTNVTLESGAPAHVRVLEVSLNFFKVLGVGARVGRTFQPGQDKPDAGVIVLSDAFWRSNLGGRRDIVGQRIRVNDIDLTVVGVMAPGFYFDRSDTDLWVPTIDLTGQQNVRRPHFLRAVARLKSGVTLRTARADLSGIARDLEREYPDTNRQMSVGVGPLDDWFFGQTRQPLLLFLAAVGLLLLIACANVANLLLFRTSERAREMSVRAALGAGRARLVRQMLAESLVIATAGAILGLALAWAGVRLFVHEAPAGLPRIDQIGLHPAVWLFAVGLTAATTLFVGLAPALQGARRDLRQGLGDGVRTTPAHVDRLRQFLVTGEVALAVVLLVGALLTARSFQALIDVDLGFSVNGLVTGRVALPSSRYGDEAKRSALFEAAVSRLRAMPAIEAAGATRRLPLEGYAWTGDLYIEGRPDVHGRELRHKSISSGYLETLGLRLIAGRTIAARDRADAPLAVVVNETLAREYFPGQDPVGHRIAFDKPGPRVRWRTIVGEVADEPQDGVGVPAAPEVYESDLQDASPAMAIAVRSSLPTSDALSDIRTVIHELDPQLAVYDAGPFSDRVAGALSRNRVSATLAGVFALTALVLAAVGVYGVAACAVAARTREIGVRVTFGATRASVLGLILRREFRYVAGGLVAGGGLAVLASRSLRSLLFGISPSDPSSYAGGLAVLLLVGLAACVIPARRALRVDPVQALRSE